MNKLSQHWPGNARIRNFGLQFPTKMKNENSHILSLSKEVIRWPSQNYWRVNPKLIFLIMLRKGNEMTDCFVFTYWLIGMAWSNLSSQKFYQRDPLSVEIRGNEIHIILDSLRYLNYKPVCLLSHGLVLNKVSLVLMINT